MKNVLKLLLILHFIFSNSIVYAADKVVVIPIYTSKKSNVIRVSTDGGDFTDPVAAVNSITDASVDKPYLVAIGPGVYTLTEPLVMKEYVSIVGAGEDATKLTGALGTSGANYIIGGADNTSISEITVENTGGGGASTGIRNYLTSPTIHNVTVIANGGSTNTWGIYNGTSNAVMINVSATANDPSADYNYAIHNNLGGSPTMTNVTATATGGVYCYGISNNGGTVTMTGVTANAGSAAYSYGIYNNNVDSNATIKNITANANAVFESYGVYNSSSSPPISNIVATAADAIENYGIYNKDSSSTISRSTIQGSTFGLYTESSSLVFPTISQSTIENGIGRSSVFVIYSCTLSDDATNAPLNPDCTTGP